VFRSLKHILSVFLFRKLHVSSYFLGSQLILYIYIHIKNIQGPFSPTVSCFIWYWFSNHKISQKSINLWYFFKKILVFKNNSKFLILVRKYGTSNVPNEFLKKSLSLVRYGTSFTKVRENHCTNKFGILLKNVKKTVPKNLVEFYKKEKKYAKQFELVLQKG